jgi:hypothetical protein
VVDAGETVQGYFPEAPLRVLPEADHFALSDPLVVDLVVPFLRGERVPEPPSYFEREKAKRELQKPSPFDLALYTEARLKTSDPNLVRTVGNDAYRFPGYQDPDVASVCDMASVVDPDTASVGIPEPDDLSDMEDSPHRHDNAALQRVKSLLDIDVSP